MVIHIMVCGENFCPLCFGGFTQRVSRRAFKSADGFAWEYSGIIAANVSGAEARAAATAAATRGYLYLGQDIPYWGSSSQSCYFT